MLYNCRQGGWLGRTTRLVLALIAVLGVIATSGASAWAQPGLTVVLGSELRSLDPSIDTNNLTLPITNTMMQALARTTPELKIVPLLAESWKAVGPTKWQITLRKGVKFTNGEPMNAEALIFSVDVFLKTKGTARGWFSFLSGAEKVDEHTVNLVTKEPTSVVPFTVGFLYVFPPAYYAKVGADGFGQNPIGTGPWKLKKWTRGVELTVEPNPDYWGKKPQVGEINFRWAPDASTRVAMLLNGEAQLANDIPPAMLERVTSSPSARIETTKTLRKVFLQMNLDQGPTADVRVRKAINQAIDVETIIKRLYQDHAYARDKGLVLEGMEGYQGNALRPYAYNPDAAKKLLAEAGYPNGFEIDFWYPIGRYLLDKEASEAIAGQLSKIGIKTKLNGMEPSAYFSKTASEKVPGINFFSCGPLFLTPTYCATVHMKKGAAWGYAANDRTDSELARIEKELDEAKRIQLVRDFENYIYNELVPWVWLWHQQGIYGVSNKLVWKPTPDEKIWFTDMSVK